MSKLPTASAPPQTPRARGHAHKASLTPSFSFGLGFSPSFQFNSPRNVNLLHSLSPQRFFQVSNSLSHAVKPDDDKENRPDKDVFADPGPHKPPTRFLDSIAAKKADDSADDSMWSLGPDTTAMTASTPQPPRQPFTPHKPQHDGPVTKKRLLESPSVSIASKIETIASPPRSARSSVSSARKKSVDSVDKVWTAELDEVLLSSYTKYKSFKASKAAEPSILKQTQQNKVLSRMILNRTGILRSPKQIASRLFKLTKARVRKEPVNHDSAESVASSLKDELDELMRTPLDDLINNSSIDGINTQDINAQIDKELDLIFSSPELQTSPFPSDNDVKLEVADFAIEYQSQNPIHHFTKIHLASPHRPVSLTATALRKVLHMSGTNDLANLTFQAFSAKKTAVFQVYNELNLNMHKNVDFNTLTSVIANANPLDFNTGSINSYMKVLVSGSGMPKGTFVNWSCNSKIYNGDEIVFELDENVNGLYNSSLHKYEVSIPFLKNFWSGFLSFMINGKTDHNMIKDLSVVQTLFESARGALSPTVHACFIHHFNAFENKGQTVFHQARWSSVDNEIKEEAESDNETVLADSSPTRSLNSSFGQTPRRNVALKIDLSSAKNVSAMGPATAPIYNPRIVQQMTHGPGNPPERSLSSSSYGHSQSTTSIPTFNRTQELHMTAQTTPDVISPFTTTPHMSNEFLNSSFGIQGNGVVTSTPSKPDLAMAAKNVNYQNYYPPGPPPANRGQLMVNTPQGFVPFQSLPPALQERFKVGQFAAQQQQQMYQAPPPQPAMVQSHDLHPMAMMGAPLASAPASQTSFAINKAPKKDKDGGIKFGPILGYDPSKDSHKVESDKREALKQQPKTSMGIRRFPVNTQVSMYQPKRK